MAAPFTIETYGSYWRNVESEHPFICVWNKGSTYTWEKRVLDKTANTGTGSPDFQYIWDSEIGVGTGVFGGDASASSSPVYTADGASNILSDPFNPNVTSPVANHITIKQPFYTAAEDIYYIGSITSLGGQGGN